MGKQTASYRPNPVAQTAHRTSPKQPSQASIVAPQPHRAQHLFKAETIEPKRSLRAHGQTAQLPGPFAIDRLGGFEALGIGYPSVAVVMLLL